MSEFGLAFKERLTLLDSGNQLPASEWIVKNTRLKGKPYSFEDHEYQLQFVDDQHRIVCAKKCAQIGFTEILLRGMLCFLVQHQGGQTIFTQPTDTDAGKFAKSRVDVLFEECDIIKRLGTGGIDSAYLKRVGQSFLNLRGTFGSKAAISVPSDFNVYDEIDFSNPRVLSQFKSRLQHSQYKWERFISTPTLPNYGVSALYDKSDQKQVVCKCTHCGYFQFITWEKHVWIRHIPTGKAVFKDPDAINAYIEKPWEFKPFIACEKCKKELDRSWSGGHREWVAAYPERAADLDNGISGYQISQLDVDFVDVADIVKASDPRFPEGFKKPQDFDNFVLGKESSGGEGQKIDDNTKGLATLQGFKMVKAASGTFIGVDLGNACNIVVLKDFWLPEKEYRVPVVVFAGEFDKEELERLDIDYMDVFRALYTVSDAQPYTTTVSKIANKPKYEDRMKICYFGGKKAYTTSDILVTANRSQMLDMVTDDLPRGDIMVAEDVPEDFWPQLKNLVKVKAEDDDGTVYYEYVKVGPDHYGLALGYALLARKMFFELKPTGTSGVAPVEISGARTTL
jgi:hypothetical protein